MNEPGSRVAIVKHRWHRYHLYNYASTSQSWNHFPPISVPVVLEALTGRLH